MAKTSTDAFEITGYTNGVMTIEHRIHVTAQTLLVVCHDMLKHVEAMQVKSLYVYQTEAFFKKAGLEDDYKLIEAIADGKVNEPFNYEGYRITPIGCNLITVEGFEDDYKIPVDVFMERAELLGHDWRDRVEMRDFITKSHKVGETFTHGKWRITVIDQNTVVANSNCQRP